MNFHKSHGGPMSIQREGSKFFLVLEPLYFSRSQGSYYREKGSQFFQVLSIDDDSDFASFGHSFYIEERALKFSKSHSEKCPL